MKKKYKIKNLDCASCAATLESHLRKIDGVVDVSIIFSTSTLQLEAADDSFDEVFKKVVRVAHEIEPDVLIEDADAQKNKKHISTKDGYLKEVK